MVSDTRAHGMITEFEDIRSEVVSLRRRVHEHPELSYHEKNTARLIAATLRDLNIEVHEGVGGTGVMGVLRGSSAGKVVALRADMDALPVKEENDHLPFKSKNEGVMHACGHDSHVAMLLGAAMLLERRRNKLHGVVKFLFQPAEEDAGRGGALPMIEAGAMKDPKVDYVFGLHVFSNYASGVFALRPGALMAAPDHFKIVVTGRGGHGSEPHKTVDPIFISAQLVVALQGIRSRLVDQTEPFVLTIASFHSGTRNNIIPSEAVLEGTIRTLNEKKRARAKELLESISQSVCSMFGASVRTEFIENAYPVTVNDVDVTKEVFEVLRGINQTVECGVVMGGEDFSRFLEQAPGTYYFLGTFNESKGCVHPNHSSKFDVDEDILVYGSVSLAELALRFTETP
jgi:carboxypeptidase Ss1